MVFRDVAPSKNFFSSSKPKRKKLTYAPKTRILVSQDYKCNVCGNKLDEAQHFDHIIPLSKAGTNAINNYRVLCANCHQKKSLRETCRAYPEEKEEENKDDSISPSDDYWKSSCF